MNQAPIPELTKDRASSTEKDSHLKSYTSTVLGQGLILGLGTLTGIFSARMLGPTGRGELAAISLWPAAICMFFSLGINQAIAYRINHRDYTCSEIITAIVPIGLSQCLLSVLAGLIIVHSALVNYSLEVRNLGVLSVCFIPAMLLGGYPANLFQHESNLLRFNLLRATPQIVYAACLTVLLLLRQQNLTSVVFSQLGGYAVALLAGMATVWCVLRPRVNWRPEAIPSLLSYGVRTQLSGLTSYFNQRIDQLFLSVSVPPGQLGLYSVAVALSTGAMFFPQAAAIVVFSRGAGQNTSDAVSTISNSFRASLIWLLLACGALYLVCPILIRVLFGHGFEGSIMACRILLPGTVMLGLNQVLYNGANALGRPALPSYAEGLSMALTAVGLYLLVPRYGYLGAAMVSSVAYSTSLVVMLVLMYRCFGISARTLILR
jgi:O-antigen/teichoic acid export membrane protein